jgi:hypothetical protein
MIHLSRTRRALALLTAGACGCAPLQQAPLVYSSKVAVGVDVSSNAAESPGVSISLGVKTVDAAYVPVAVSKKADDKAPAGERTPDIVPIHANYGEGSLQRDAQQNKQKADDYAAAQSAAAEAASNVARLQAASNQAKQKQASIAAALVAIDGLGPLPPAPSSTVVAAMSPASATELQTTQAARLAARKEVFDKSVKPRLAELADAGVPPIASDGDLSATRAAVVTAQQKVNTEIDVLDKSLTLAVPAANDKKAIADRLLKDLADAARQTQTTKTDAMSVFGRFDSNASGSVPGGAASGNAAGAGLLVGKVFSTGLASQNLTEATKVGAVSACISNALTAAGAASASMSDANRLAMVSALAQVCGGKPGQ